MPSDFEVPLSNEKLSNEPLDAIVLSHSLGSLSNVGGFQCLVVLDASQPFPPSLGLPSHNCVAENTCFLQVTSPYEVFQPQRQADENRCLEVTLEEYLNLFAFFLQRWPMVHAKMGATVRDMQKRDAWVSASNHVKFMSVGRCSYTVTIGANLGFRAEATMDKEKGDGAFFFRAELIKDGKSVPLPLDTCRRLFAAEEDFALLSSMYKKDL